MHFLNISSAFNLVVKQVEGTWGCSCFFQGIIFAYDFLCSVGECAVSII